MKEYHVHDLIIGEDDINKIVLKNIPEEHRDLCIQKGYISHYVMCDADIVYKGSLAGVERFLKERGVDV